MTLNDNLKLKFFKSLLTSENVEEFKLDAVISLHRRTVTKWTKKYFYTINFLYNGKEETYTSKEYSELSELKRVAWDVFMQRNSQTAKEKAKRKEKTDGTIREIN